MGSQKKWFLSSFLAAIAILGLIAIMSAPTSAVPPRQGGWEENFSGPVLDTSRWLIANEPAPGYIPGNHAGIFQPANVFVSNGNLVLCLTQSNGLVDGNPAGVISRGGMIYTRSTYGFGTYEMRMRMSSVAPSADASGASASGSVSAGFTYDKNSQSEVDMEFAGHAPNTLFMTNWRNKSPASDPTSEDGTSSTVPMFGISETFKVYKFVWKRGSVSYYVDGVLQATHTTDVPINRAHFMLSHWGTNRSSWGGPATIGQTRYFYVDWAKYAP